MKSKYALNIVITIEAILIILAAVMKLFQYPVEEWKIKEFIIIISADIVVGYIVILIILILTYSSTGGKK